MIATGYPPYLFSENLCNGKLVMALMEAGIEVDVISRVDEGPSYGSEWTEPWNMLEPTANIISYPTGNRFTRLCDIIYSGLIMDGNFQAGVRWMRRAYQKALMLIKTHHYDAILTRSPNDISHFIGEKLKKKTGLLWIANWNDPAAPIWPGQYCHNFTDKVQKQKMNETARLLRAADINSFPSDSLRQHFIESFPFLKDSCTAIFPHIGLCERFWPKPSEQFDDRKLRFLHSGNLSSERNPETTFKALRRLIDDGFKDFEFHIMGHINAYTHDLIVKIGLDNHVKCIGSFPYIEALSIMQAYDILVLIEARLEKGIFFASKFSDYLQTGKPILAISPTDGFAVDMLCDKHGEYLADNTDEDSIYYALKQIVTSWKAGTLSMCASECLFKKLSASEVAVSYRKLINDYEQSK